MAAWAGESHVKVQSKLWSEFKANLGNSVKNLPQNHSSLRNEVQILAVMFAKPWVPFLAQTNK